MLLVVAADEGVKPQTREHLAICGLLGIPAGLAVLTKTDLVTDDLLELARLEVEELLAASPFAGAPPCWRRRVSAARAWTRSSGGCSSWPSATTPSPTPSGRPGCPSIAPSC